LGASLFLVGACALPVPVQIAHWALDGISYLATEKSLGDHGISLVANQDCAVLRAVLVDGQICRDRDEDGGVAVADAGSANDAIDVAAIARFETAAGPGRPVAGEPRAALQPAKRIHQPMMFEDGVALSGYPLVIEADAAGDLSARIDAAKGGNKGAKKRTDAGAHTQEIAAVAGFETAAGEPQWRAKATRMTTGAAEPETGLYFVIGSFREHENALKLRKQYQSLMPAILAASLDQGMVYRVVVGPFDHKDAKEVHQRIFRAGIVDSWAIRVNPGEWSMAMIDPPAEAPALADLGQPGWAGEIVGYLKKLTRWIY
jgi:hypothetical protein